MFLRTCLIVAFSAVLTACPTAQDEPLGLGQGEEGGPCGEDGECFGDLTCVSNVCVDSGGSDDSETGAGEGCDECPGGTALDEADCSCTDIDECETDNGGCDVNATCENADTSGEVPTCACKDGYFGDGSSCSVWAECTTDEYESAAPTTTSDRACTTLTTCTAAQYESTAATQTTDRACTALTTCTAAQYESTAATPTTDRACTALTTCTAAQYESAAATPTTDRACTPLTTCTAAQYESTAATPTTDRGCTALTTCTAAEYESTAATPTSDRGCTALTTCTAAEYETAAATPTTDRACTALTTCTAAQYESTAATPTSDRGCTALTTCTAAEYESTAATPTSDRVCDCDTGFEYNESHVCVPVDDTTDGWSNESCEAAGGSVNDVGDGYCDDVSNIESCGWDSGDCCASTCVDGTYTCGFGAFACRNPDAEDYVSLDPQLCVAEQGEVDWLGDGYCDSENNQEACAWDSGDCCESTCQDSAEYACGMNGFDCQDPAADPTTTPPDPCEGISEVGVCYGDIWLYCDQSNENPELVTEDCGAAYATCGEIEPGVLGCTGQGECGDLTLDGTCDGSQLNYCAYGVPISVDCSSSGQSCGVNPDHGENYMDCVSRDPTACGAETYYGRCDGETLVYCWEGAIKSIDCAANDYECAQDLTTGFNCVPSDQLSTCEPACGPQLVCEGGLCHANGSQEREWTFLVYMVGDNNLSAFAYTDIDEMETVGSTDQVSIVVQAEFSSEYRELLDNAGDISPALLDNSFRFEVGYHSERGVIDEDLVVNGAIGNQDMGHPTSLTEFIQWGTSNYPANHYALALWDHGGGWIGGFRDETSESELRLADIRGAIEDAGVYLDLLDFDACLMGQYEVALELNDLIGVMVASEHVEPGDGNPYDRLLLPLIAAPTSTPRELGTIIVDTFAEDYLEKASMSATKSALDMSTFSTFHQYVSALANALRLHLRENRVAVRDSILDAQHYDHVFYRDLGDFALTLMERDDLPSDVTQAAADLAAFIQTDSFISANRFVNGTDGTELDVSRSYGVSAFLPSYRDLLCPSRASKVSDYVAELTYRQRISAWVQLVEELATGSGSDLADISGTVTLTWYHDETHSNYSDADMDLYLVDACGDSHAAWIGTATPIGVFGGDSWDTGLSLETFTFASQVIPGTYTVMAEYYENGSSHQSAWPEVSVHIETSQETWSYDGFRLDSAGAEVPMSLDSAYQNPVDAVAANQLDDDEWQTLTSHGYSDAWLIEVVSVGLDIAIENCSSGGGVSDWMADGYCDSINNQAACQWDGGDCCSSTCEAAEYTCGHNGYDCQNPTGQ